VALATCPTRACINRYHANFFIKRLLESMLFRVDHIELLGVQGKPATLTHYGESVIVRHQHRYQVYHSP